MMAITTLTYQQRLDALRAAKLQQTREKQTVLGAMDHDDWAVVLPPPELRELIDAISGSGEPITDCIFKGWKPRSNHPSGGFFGPRAVGDNYRDFLEHHPVYIDPNSSLAGAYMFNFMSYRKPYWNPDFDYSHLQPEQEKYTLIHGIGGSQHFCQDLQIGLDLGWQGLLEKIRHYRKLNYPHGHDFYHGIGSVVHGVQDWIRRHADAASAMAAQEADPALRQNLEEIAAINAHLVTEPPRTFREACQWILWYQMTARMFNGSGSLGRLDVLLAPYYVRDTAAGLLTDEEAIFHIACLLLRDTAYIQLGGPDADGHDVTNHLSYLVLEAGHRLGIPANIGVSVGAGVDPGLLERGVEIIVEDRQGYPKFLGSDHVVAGTAKNGVPLEVARTRTYSGCHWSAIPGREYGLMDIVKVNFGAVFDVALRDMLADEDTPNTLDALWDRFVHHLERAVAVVAEGLDFHMEHMHDVFPELVLDLCCHGPIEKGLDASHGGVEFYLLGVDGAALATVADSFAAIEQRVVHEERLTWEDLLRHLDAELVRPGRRESPANDEQRAALWTRQHPRRRVREAHQPGVQRPGDGQTDPGGLPHGAGAVLVGADDRDGSAGSARRRTAAARASRSRMAPIRTPAFARTARRRRWPWPWRRFSPVTAIRLRCRSTWSRRSRGTRAARAQIASLIRTHFDLGGTQINMNVLDTQTLLEAYEDPSKYPDLVVRVTGFSAYFSSLSPEFRKMVVDRVLAAEKA